HQAEPLARLIEHAGGTAIRFPTLAIEPARDPDTLQRVFDRLAHYDIVIFVSPNAVEQAFALLTRRALRFPAGVRVGAVGAGSAGLRYRYDMAGDVGRAGLRRTPVVVLSEAQAALCRALGFAHAPRVAAAASDAAILSAIEAWRASGFSL